jgi:hypothetical protein
MKRWFLAIVFSLILLVPAAGCNNGPLSVGTGEIFTLAQGDIAKISGEALSLTFDSVIGDSRCPQNVTCVWEGVASCEITIDYQGNKYSLAINQPGLSDQAQTTFFEYTLTYSLNPYPREGEQIQNKDYRLTMTVSK